MTTLTGSGSSAPSSASGADASAGRSAPSGAHQTEAGGRAQANVAADGQLRVTSTAPTGPNAEPSASRTVERVDVSVSSNGQVRLQQQAPSGGETATGIMIVEVVQQRGAIQVEVADFRRSDAVQYRATLADGSPLPAWIRIDAASGRISADPPPNAQAIDIRLLAQDPSGTARTLEIKIDLSGSAAPRSDALPPGAPVVQARPGFMQQVDWQQHQWGGYGQHLMAAFGETRIE